MGDCVIDLDQSLVDSLRGKVAAATSQPKRCADHPPRTIFRVPAIIRDAHPQAFNPKAVAIGPYHRDAPLLKATDKLKLRYLAKVLGRNPSATLEDYLKAVKRVEGRARSHYSDNIEHIGSNEFVEMMLIDGCFVAQLLLMQTEEEDDAEEDEDDPILHTTWTLPLVEFDLLMLENQIPFCILEAVFDLATAPVRDEEKTTLDELLLEFFSDLLPYDGVSAPWDESSRPKFHHVLHFFHSLILPRRAEDHHLRSKFRHFVAVISKKLTAIKRMSSSSYHRILRSIGMRPKKMADHTSLPQTPDSVPCATKLMESGVKFEEKKKATSFLDVTFERGVMKIPKLQVYDHTSSLLRNLIAFEQCYSRAGTHVAAYAVLMDCLVDTGLDVALLHEEGCIVNGLGNDKDAAALFNQLCKEVAIDYGNCYLASLFEDVERHCQGRWNRYRAKAMHDYFSNPWAIFSLIGALLVIFLTIAQTVFAILAYVKPPN